MGSFSEQVWINLDILASNPMPKVPLETVLETVWAITHSVYTNDTEVNFLRLYLGGSEAGSRKEVNKKPLAIIRSFLVNQMSKPAEIANLGKRIAGDGYDRQQLELDPSAPRFTQLVRKMVLHITHRDDKQSSSSDFVSQDSGSCILSISAERDRVRGVFFHNSSYDHDWLLDVADTIQRVAETATASWVSPLSTMDFLGPRNRLRLERSAVETSVIGPNVMGDILTRWSRDTPDQVAVDSWDGSLTYAELELLARKMAVQLLRAGIAVDERVGFFMKKSRWSIITFWGLLYAGVTGVPLDVRNPIKRTRALLKRVEARFVIVDEWTTPELQGLEEDDITVWRCDEAMLEAQRETDGDVEWPRITAKTVAFILFTSGSTGLPKGVIVEHGPLYGSTVEIARELCLTASSRTFQFSMFVVDICMGDIFSTMYVGGTVCVPSEEQRLSDLQSVLENSRSTHACLTSSVISQLHPEALTHLRYIVAIGEAISKENTVRWRPYVHMISAYGITESIVYDSFASPEHLASDYRNIGLAKGPCLWISDMNDPERLLPVGAVGEILIEGPLLARGYMGDAKKTAERFIPAPAWLRAHRGPRENHGCYRSGDYGIANGDGTVLYLGRADSQVKVRGQRVELGEIAHSLLNAEPALDQVAVEAVTLQSRGNRQALAAFIRRKQPGYDRSSDSPILPLDDESRLLFRKAQNKLQDALPPYMVPSLFISVADLPKSAVGKRDRNTLLRWGAALTEEQVAEYQLRDASAYRSPETPEETLLQTLWAEVLGAPETSLGADDNFFQAGGDSIKAIELLAALRERGRRLTVSDVFQNPMMREMAKMLETVERAVGEAGIEDEIPLPFDLIASSSAPSSMLSSSMISSSVDSSPLTGPSSPSSASSLSDSSLSRVDIVKEAAKICNVSEDAIKDIYPATPLQEALMAISAQQADVYTHRLVFKLPESIDVERFKKAWEMLIAEQVIFRTCIATLQVVGAAQIVVACPETSWFSDMSLDEFIQFDKKTPLDYGAILNRWAMVKGEDKNGDTYFVWSGHHSITDGWSRPAMFDELKHIYLHGSARPQAPFTPFIKHITSELNYAEADEFWLDQFPDTVDAFPRLPETGYTPRPQSVQSLSVKLARRPTSSPITTATVVQAAWALVNATYANADEAIFGLTLSGRDAPVAGITKTMGVTITTVPLRIVPDSTSSILEYLQDVQQHMSEVKQHQHVGLQRISRLGPEARSAAGFQNLLVVQPADEEKDHEAMVDLGLELVQREERDTSQYALTLQCTINNDMDNEDRWLQVKAYFDDNVIDAKQMECLLHLFEHIIKQLATESDELSLHHVDRMSPHDLALLDEFYGRGPPPAAVEHTLHGILEERARTTPNAEALDDGSGKATTYAELDDTTTRLAHHLHVSAGVGLESRVVLSFAKSRIPIIAMLATLKSGGICVSTNPEHPTPRLVELIKDAESDVVLCDESSVARFEGYAKHIVSVTETLLSELKKADVNNVSLPDVRPTSGSFVVFTSGSTGKPKGSLLEHRSLATDLTAVYERVSLDASSRTLQFSSYTFDAHILEIFGTFMVGGCVCVISDHDRMNRLCEVINERKVSFALLTKTVSRLLEPEQVPTLKSLILSGEPNSRQDYWRWSGRVRLHNGLGPSECTPLVCLSRNPVAKDDDPANIGHALACRVWIADHRNRDKLVPIGCIGELTVEGAIVGRGYLNRPKENAASFFVDPAWSRGAGAGAARGESRRFYRSGDLARMNADGSITFIGRADNQIKIHGQRVELGEIEDQLRRCSPFFNMSAVEALEVSSRGGATALAVFCSQGYHTSDQSNGAILPLDIEAEAAFRAAQTHLNKILPQYMVPSLFFPVCHLPFNASGKLERNTLKGWFAALDASVLGQYYLADRTDSREPATASEKCLQTLWAKVLDVPPQTIFAEDNFFRRGGDSVLSMRLIAMARAQGIGMTVAEVFRTPVLKDMAQVVDGILSKDNEDKLDASTSSAPTDLPYEPFSMIKDKIAVDVITQDAARDCNVSPEDIEDIYPCNPTQEALMAVSSHRPKAYTYQVTLKLPATMSRDSFKAAWEKLVATQAIFRTRIIFRRGVGSLQVALRPDMPVPWKRVSGVSLKDYLDTEGHLLVEYGSTLSTFALLEYQNQTTFVGTLHHALYDGWSLMRTYEIFSDIYINTQQQGVVPYSKFFQYLSAIDESEMDDFWRLQFPTPIKSFPQLPISEYVPQPRKNRTSTIPFDRKTGSHVTLATVVQAAWALLISKYSESKDVICGQMLSGRDAPVSGIEDIIGPTVATVPLPIRVEQDMTLAELLDAVQTKTAEVRKYQHAGLQRIRRLSSGAAAAVEFQNMLIVHTMGDAEITSPLGRLGMSSERGEIEEFLDLALLVECSIKPESETLELLMHYDDNIVTDQQADFMLHQLKHMASLLLEGSGSSSLGSMKLKDVHLASPYDLQHLDSWKKNNVETTITTRDLNATLHSLFEAQSSLTHESGTTAGDGDDSMFNISPSNCSIWVTESNNPDRLAPVGCVGELLVESPMLARVDLASSDAPRAAFIKNPAWSTGEKNSLFYRTGYLASFRPDGSVKLIGRADEQVYLYGQRLDLASIESLILQELPKGAEAVVEMTNPESTSSENGLTAFVKLPSFTVEAGSVLVKRSQELEDFRAAVAALKISLSESLPQYKIPSHFVPISHMPVERSLLVGLSQSLTSKYVPLCGSAAASRTTDKESAPTNSVEFSLQLIWSQILNISLDDIDVNAPFTSLGGDSITAMQVVSECRKLGIKLKVATILSKKTIQAIAPHCTVKSTFESATAATATAAADGVQFELSPVQKLYFEREGQQWTRFNQGFLVRLRGELATDDVQRAFSIIVGRHAMLRARFRQTNEGHWVQYTVSAADKDVYRFKSHSLTRTSTSQSSDEYDENIDACVQACAKESLEALNIITGPVFSVDLFDVNGEDCIVYMAAHHLAIDLVSWRVVWRDLEDILRKGQISAQIPISFKDWLTLQKQSVMDDLAMVSAASTYLSSLPSSQYDYWSVPESANTIENIVETSFALSPEATNLILGKANNGLRTNTLDIVIGVLLYSFQDAFRDRQVPSVLIEHHGRETFESLDDAAEDVDLSETVGWFTSFCPLHVPLEGSKSSITDAVRLAKDTRRSVPKNGQPYFAYSRLFSAPEQAGKSQHASAELQVNYAGIFQQLETDASLVQLEQSRARADKIQESDPRCRRHAMIELEIGVTRGVMQFSFFTHKDMAHRDRFSAWINGFEDALGSALPQLAAQPQTWTLSDFPHLRLLKLSYDELQGLVNDRLPQNGFLKEQSDELIEDIYPCTAMQHGILLSQQTSSDVYHLRYIWEFKDNPLLGGSDENRDLISRLSKSWETLTQRHASLRTAIIEYATDNGHFVQIALKELPSDRFVVASNVIPDYTHISDVSEPERDAFWTHVPRLTAYRTETGRLACALKLSHALIDGTSLDLLINELVNLVLGKDDPFASPSSSVLNFGKYVEYEQTVNTSEDLEYWADYLRGVQPCHIPIMNKSSSNKHLPSAVEEYDYLKLPLHTAEGLDAFSRRLGVTQAAVLQTAWAIVLSAFTGQDDVCFGYLASGRDAPLAGIENSISLFISMQVCRVRMDMQAGMVKSLLQDVNDDMIAGLDHRNSSLGQIQSMLGLQGSALFNTCMTVRRFLGDEAAAQMDSLVTTVQGPERTEFAIALDASVGPASAELGMSYQRTRIPPSLASSIAGSFESVIRSLIRSQDAPVRDVDLIGKRDLQQVESWNSPPPTKVEETLHGLVERQALAAPEGIATSGFDGEYTYSQLNAMANKLAAHLQSCGVDIEKRVVLCMVKSTWPVVSMLAVLKAGGVCVSTNPDHPTARLLDVVQDVEATVVLSDDLNVTRFHGHVPHAMSVNEGFLSQLAAPSESWTPPVVRPDNAAFVVYTSGSTGKPKGILLEHHSVSKSQLINAEAMRITPTTRVMQFAAYTFDASICEIFAPLVVGACLCVISDEERMNDLAAAINARRADWIMLTPTVAQLFTPASVPTLKTLVFGGEPLSRKALQIWQGHVHLVNYWGPSECANSGCLNREVALNSNPMNIGRASGCNVWISLQGNPHKLAPVGCVGEMIVEGTMLGREYINRPEATAGAFVTDLAWTKSLASSAPKRFYRTGDLGLLNADGSVTIAGRADNQVKIHGQRVELDEIKHQIATCLPKGSEVVIDVCAVGGDSQKPLLTAFIKLSIFITDSSSSSTDSPGRNNLTISSTELQQQFTATVGQLKQALPGILPPYMIPTAFIPVCRVPTTPSAKTDRKKLREHALTVSRKVALMQEANALKKQPSTDTERELHAIWVKVLNQPSTNIGIDDTFMSLGGDSITAMQVVAHARKIGLKLPVSIILQKKKISAIAPHCQWTKSRTITADSMRNQAALAKAEEGTPFGLSPIQKRYFEQEHNNSSKGRLRYNQSLFVRANQNISAQTLQEAFDSIVARHSMLRARFLQTDLHGWQQVILPQRSSSLYRLVRHELAKVDQNTINHLSQESADALDIVDGPVFSVDVFDIANQDKVLFLTAHHLVVDIVSWQLILGDLNSEVMRGGKIQPTDVPTLTFQQWADLLEAEAKDESRAKEEVLPFNVPNGGIAFWKVPMAANTFKNLTEISFELPEAATDMILKLSNKTLRTTPLEILLGPMLLSFCQQFTERDIPSLFIEHHGREAICDDSVEPSQVVGWFTTMYPVPVPIEAHMSTTESVRLVKDTRRKVPRNGFPYFSQRHLSPQHEKALAAQDPVEILVNYSGGFQQLESSEAAVHLESRVKSTVSDADPSALRWAMINVEIGVTHGLMHVSFLLNKNMAHLDRVQQWIKHYESMLTQTASDLLLISPIQTLSDFPLLDMSHDQLSVLLTVELPRLGFSNPSDVVQDILPTSPFQNFALQGHLDPVSPRHWLDYWFDLPGDADNARLQQTCTKLVEHYSILRTLFIRRPSSDGFLQIVLKSIQPQVDIMDVNTDSDITHLMEDAFNHDLAALPSFGSPFLRFTILRTQNEARLLMRLSHAQFDGFSRVSFLDTLATIYSGQKPASGTIDYADFIQHTKKTHKQGCDYWRTTLAGAKPTTVIPTTEQPKFPDQGVLRAEKTIPPFKKLEGVTSATLFNAACAILIHSLTKSSEVTFCRITSGRAALDATFQELIGPCVNLIPVRVHFPSTDALVRPQDVLHQIHKQYIDSIPHETVGLDDIIRNCTDWTTSLATFPIITQHLNLEEGSEVEIAATAAAELKPNKFRVHVWDPETVDPFPWSLALGAFPTKAGVKISITANSKYAEQSMVDGVLDGLCEVIESITQ